MNNIEKQAQESQEMVKNAQVMSQEELNKLFNMALDNCKEIYSEYFINMLLQRIYNDKVKPSGSFIYGVKDETELENILRSMDWEVESANEEEGKIVLKSKNSIPYLMKLGIISLNDLPENAVLKGLNPKDDASLEESKRPRTEVGVIVDEKTLTLLPDAEFVRIIIVTHNELKKLIVVTFFPEITESYPMIPSKISPLTLAHGEDLTIEKAKELRFEYAKVTTTEAFGL